MGTGERGERSLLENGRMRKHSSGEIKDFSQLRKNFYKIDGMNLACTSLVYACAATFGRVFKKKTIVLPATLFCLRVFALYRLQALQGRIPPIVRWRLCGTMVSICMRFAW